LRRCARACARALYFLCFLFVLARPAPALAHAALISTAPLGGSVLASPPAQAELVFDEPVSPLVFTLISPDGKTVSLHRVRQKNDRVLIDLPPLAGKGTFGLSWRVVSADGHPVGGTFVFSVGAPGGAKIARGHRNVMRDAAIWLGRFLLYACLFFGVGAALFRAWARRGPAAAPGIAVAVLAAGVLLVPATVALQGLDALNAPFSAWLRPNVWQTALATSYGMSAALSLAALLLALVSLAVDRRPARVLALAAMVAVGLALAASGHASTAAPRWLARPAVWLHGVAVGCWLGSLVPLWRMLERPGPAASENLQWFSRWIKLAVAALAISGLALVYLQFDRVSSLWRTSYGQVLMVKLALLVVLFGLAVYNRYRLTARVVGGDVDAARAMRRVIAAEIGVALCVLAVVSVWRFTMPPRTMAMAESVRPVSFHVHTPQAMAMVTITPPHGHHPAAMDIALMKNDGGVLEPEQVTVYFSDAAAGVQPVRRAARRQADGTWRIARLNLPPLGAWTVRIDALVSDFDRIRLETKVRLGF